MTDDRLSAGWNTTLYRYQQFCFISQSRKKGSLHKIYLKKQLAPEIAPTMTSLYPLYVPLFYDPISTIIFEPYSIYIFVLQL